MKEIHAYQNQDGTYKVNIVNSSEKTKTIGKAEVKEFSESKVEISRAEIKITAYTSDRNDGELLSVEIKE